MKTKPKQESLNLVRKETLNFSQPLYYINEKSKLGVLSQLALESGDWEFDAVHVDKKIYNVTHESGLSFHAELKKGKSKKGGTYQIKGTVKDANDNKRSFFEGLNIQGEGNNGEKLRAAQLGAVHSLLAHWSLSNEVATVVLPTGTGKTETMLVTTLANRAVRTLVVVPTIELKDQIAEKFQTWGMLRRLGVIPKLAPNPKVLVINRTLQTSHDVQQIKKADIVITTPALIARSDLKLKIQDSFSHVYFDEAHHVVAGEWDEIKSLFTKAKIVQFTATPYRNDRKAIEGKVVYNYPLSQALKDKCFSKISLVTVDERHPRKKDKAIADAAMSRLIEDRKKGWNRHRMMVRAENMADAENLYRQYQEWYPNERITLVHSKTKGKKSIIEQIKNGKYDIIVCVDMLKEGFDYPDFKIAAVHGIHKSLAVLLQFIGRFTRTQEGLGDASFIVNYAEEKMSQELENLFQEGSGWEEVISEIADAKKKEAESLLAFLQGCKPYSGFDSPDVKLNPKLVFPALSCVCYRCEKVDWSAFKDAFHLAKYALSQPYINKDENVFYFTTQKRERVKWSRTDEMRDQTWGLVLMHYDAHNKLLYVGYSEKRLDVNKLVEKIAGKILTPLNGDCVFRSFDSIKRLSIVHAGIFKPANHLHRYSRLSGADVTEELKKWKTGGRCQKSDFVGIGFRNGFPVSVGASVKGKIWSPARIGTLKEWKSWCLEMGQLITNESIDSNQLLEDSAAKTQLKKFPDGLIVLSADWSEGLYDRIHKLTLEKPRSQSLMLSEATLKFENYMDEKANFKIHAFDEVIEFTVALGGEKGHIVYGLDDSPIAVEGLKSSAISLKQFFQENPPTMFLLDGCTISGCIHTDYGDCDILDIPSDRIQVLKWENVDYTVESLYKKGKVRDKSVQEYIMKLLVARGAKIVFNDDNSGESADVIAIFLDDNVVRFEMVHCKYSKAAAGSRTQDLHEVCGQTIISLRYKWKPELLLKHLERRNGTGVLKGKRFYHGSDHDIEIVRKALKFCDVQFEFAIAQPGVESSKLTADMRRILGSVYSTVMEMTETKLRCYFT